MPALHRRLLLSLPLAALSRPAAAADPAFTPAFTIDTLMARMAATGPRRAPFTESRRFAALDTTLESGGWLSFQDGRLLKVTEWPQPERLEVDGQRVIITAGNEPPRVIEMSMAPPLRVLIDAIRGPLSGNLEALHRSFRTTLSGTPAAWRLDLTPLSPGPLRSISLQGTQDAITQIEATQPNGDTQTTKITLK